MAKVPASIRCNNPGAMYPGPAATQFGSTRYEVLQSKDGTHKIAIFDDPVLGAAAMFFLLASKNYVGRTIQQAIAKWCGGFYVSTYISVLEGKGGVTRDTTLTRDMVLIPEVAIPICRAMAWQEAGTDYPMNEEQWTRAHGLAFGRIPMESKDAVAMEGPKGGTPPPPEPHDEGIIFNMPNTIPTVQAPAAKSMAKSGTIWGSFLVLLSTMAAWAEASVRFALDWAAQIMVLGPVNSILAGLGHNVKAWSFGMTIGACLLVGTRRVLASLEGKKG